MSLSPANNFVVVPSSTVPSAPIPVIADVPDNPCLPEVENAGKWKRWERDLLIFIGIIVVIVVILAIIYFGFIRKGQPTGSPCKTDDDCEAYHHCAGDYTCKQGTGESSAGSFCNSVSDCVAGQLCINERCSSNRQLGTSNDFCRSNEDCDDNHDCANGRCVKRQHRFTEQASFKEAEIIYTDKDGRRYYLAISDRGSVWSQTRPTVALVRDGDNSGQSAKPITYTYSQVQQQLQVNIDDKSFPIRINNVGQMFANTSDSSFSKIVFFRDGGVRSFRDAYGNQIRIACPRYGEPRRKETAFFADSNRYISQPRGIKSNRVYIHLDTF